MIKRKIFTSSCFLILFTTIFSSCDFSEIDVQINDSSSSLEYEVDLSNFEGSSISKSFSLDKKLISEDLSLNDLSSIEVNYDTSIVYELMIEMTGTGGGTRSGTLTGSYVINITAGTESIQLSEFSSDDYPMIVNFSVSGDYDGTIDFAGESGASDSVTYSEVNQYLKISKEDYPEFFEKIYLGENISIEIDVTDGALSSEVSGSGLGVILTNLGTDSNIFTCKVNF